MNKSRSILKKLAKLYIKKSKLEDKIESLESDYRYYAKIELKKSKSPWREI